MLRLGGFTQLAAMPDDAVGEAYPNLVSLLDEPLPEGSVGPEALRMLRDAVNKLEDERVRSVAVVYLATEDDEPTPHEDRLEWGRSALGMRQRGKPWSESEFRQKRVPNQILLPLVTILLGSEEEVVDHDPIEAQRAPAEWPVKPEPSGERDIVILIASRAKREGPASPLARLVREFEQYWRLTRPTIYAVRGSFAALWRCGLLHDYEHFVPLGAGFEGGVISAAELVVAAAEVAWKPKVAVVYLTDPQDASALYPETGTLKRECVLTKTPFLTSYHGARRWFSLEWACRAASEGGAAEHLLLTRPERGFPPVLDRHDRPHGAIALAAHDRHKLAMMRFAQDYAALLTERFPTRYATEITGRLLNGTPVDGYTEEIRGDPRTPAPTVALRRKQRSWRKRKPAGGLGRAGWVTELTRGRWGGVVQLAGKVLDVESQLGTVIFFQDAERPEEQELEMQLLDRAAQLPKSECLILHDERSARTWAANLARCVEAGRAPSPFTLVQAFRHVFGVELVLAHGDTDDDPERVWGRVVRTAATYALGVTLAAVERRRKDREPVRVGVPWGGAVHDVVSEIDGALGVWQFVESNPPAELRNLRRAAGRSWPPAPRRRGFVSPAELRVLPTVGLVGARDREFEAHTIIEKLIASIGGAYASYPEYAYLLRDAAQAVPSTTLREEWDQLDLLLLGTAPLKPGARKRVVGLPPELLATLEELTADNTVSNLSTFYLQRDHESGTVDEADYGQFRQTGISRAQVKALVERGAQVVLVAGAEEQRLLPVLTALKDKLATTLVTDPAFAWNVLCAEVAELG